MLELGMTFSMEQLVIDNDIALMTKKAMQGIFGHRGDPRGRVDPEGWYR